MPEQFDTLPDLDTEKAISYAALSAVEWSERLGSEGGTGRKTLQSLMDATAWVTRARAHEKQQPFSVHELIEAFECSLDQWLPTKTTLQLLMEGDPTPFCIELATDSGAFPGLEVEQRIICKVMDFLRGGQDSESRYRTFRRFLVENSSAKENDAARHARECGITLSHLYEPIPGYARVLVGGRECFYPCPRCRWPMKVTQLHVSCAFSMPCLAAGAKFKKQARGLLPLGSFEAPQPQTCSGWGALLQGVWRYTSLPGLEELALEARLKSIPGVQVSLWPFMDYYDLDVQRGTSHWRVDVKDYATAPRLARYLNERPTEIPTWIVVPDSKKDQVKVLQNLVKQQQSGYEFASLTEFTRIVENLR